MANPEIPPSKKPELGYRGCLTRVLLGFLLSIALFIWAFTSLWNGDKLTSNFDTKYAERSAIVALIKSKQLKRTKLTINKEQAITYSQVSLTKEYKRIAQNNSVKVAEKKDILEIAFPIRTWQFGDGKLFFVYRSDTKLNNKVKLTPEDFLLFNGANLFHAEKVAPNWYKVSEEW